MRILSSVRARSSGFRPKTGLMSVGIAARFDVRFAPKADKR